MMENLVAAQARSVLVVDDELDTAEMLVEMMHLSGYQVFKSYGGRQAIQLVNRERPDVVLLDVMMPDVSGLDVLHYMRRDPRLQKIPVIILSARCMPSDIKSGLDAGANLYLTKPVGCADLRSAVEEVISGGKANPGGSAA
jgi:two-component system, OmpR family, alkaline phosphatase synthesis response regulator PhoP